MVHKKSSIRKEKDTELDVEEAGEDAELIDMEERAEEKMKELRAKLAECQKEKQEYLDGWHRLKADNLNSKKRHETEREREKDRLAAGLVEKLIPLCDSFDMALRSTASQSEGEWQKGVEQIYSQLIGIMKSYNVTIIAPLGAPFDPKFHDAVSEKNVGDEAQHNLIADVLQNGYAIGDYLIRPAKVVVGNYEQS